MCKKCRKVQCSLLKPAGVKRRQFNLRRKVLFNRFSSVKLSKRDFDFYAHNFAILMLTDKFKALNNMTYMKIDRKPGNSKSKAFLKTFFKSQAG